MSAGSGELDAQNYQRRRVVTSPRGAKRCARYSTLSTAEDRHYGSQYINRLTSKRAAIHAFSIWRPHSYVISKPRCFVKLMMLLLIMRLDRIGFYAFVANEELDCLVVLANLWQIIDTSAKRSFDFTSDVQAYTFCKPFYSTHDRSRKSVSFSHSNVVIFFMLDCDTADVN